MTRKVQTTINNTSTSIVKGEGQGGDGPLVCPVTLEVGNTIKTPILSKYFTYCTHIPVFTTRQNTPLLP